MSALPAERQHHLTVCNTVPRLTITTTANISGSILPRQCRSQQIEEHRHAGLVRYLVPPAAAASRRSPPERKPDIYSVASCPIARVAAGRPRSPAAVSNGAAGPGSAERGTPITAGLCCHLGTELYATINPAVPANLSAGGCRWRAGASPGHAEATPGCLPQRPLFSDRGAAAA